MRPVARAGRNPNPKGGFLVKKTRLALVAAAVVLAAVITGRGTAAGSAHDFVYTETNAASGNAIQIYSTGADGSLVPQGSVATGGLGTGAALASQGSVVVRGPQLFAVNAGDNTISAFRRGADGSLTPMGAAVSSGGSEPISLTVHGQLLYVLDAGSLTISGFTIGGNGLSPLPGSTRPLTPGASSPEQIGFNPGGRVLVVTEKASNTIDTFGVNPSGRPSSAHSNASTGDGPYGFAFDTQGQLLVTDASSNAVSVYALGSRGNLTLINGPVSTNGQGAPCWLAIAGSGRFAYSANTASGTISGFSLQNGRLALLDPSGISASPGASPFDLAVSPDGHFLYNLASGSNLIAAFRLHSDGSLTATGTATGLPASEAGLATG
jgi:DNA-binding beta-propeller fold protein YncE